jgi:biotin carboxyl carrier protein
LVYLRAVRYFVALDPEAGTSPAAVDLVVLPGGRLEVRVDGRTVDVDVERLGAHTSVRVGGRVLDLTLEGAWPEVSIAGGARRGPARVESERSRLADDAVRARPGAIRRDAVVRSPMPGRVVRVLVAPGDAVTAGQGVAVLEAMKMENEVKTSAPGVVAEVHVRPGAAVEASAPLVTFAREPGA